LSFFFLITNFIESISVLEKQVNRAPAAYQIDHPADRALSSVCRLAVVVNSDWHNPPKLIKFGSAVPVRDFSYHLV